MERIAQLARPHYEKSEKLSLHSIKKANILSLSIFEIFFGFQFLEEKKKSSSKSSFWLVWSLPSFLTDGICGEEPSAKE